MTTLLTGAGGFVGSAVARRLLQEGHEVRALVRAGSDRRNLQGLDLELVEGDLLDAASLGRAASGCDCLFHAAADYRLWTPAPDIMYETNVAGTRNLLLRAAAAGATRMVYTSSVATLGANPDRAPADETTPVALEDMIGHYKRSKFLAEQAVLALVENERLPVIIVNPSTPVGPRDIKPTPTGRIIVDALRNRMPAYVDTGLNIAHVDDVAAGHLQALARGKPGERYILGGEDMTLKNILDVINEIRQRPGRLFKLPHGLAYSVAVLAEKWAALSGKEPFVTVDGVNMARKYMYFSSARARRELGYAARPAREALEDAIDWFQQNGYC